MNIFTHNGMRRIGTALALAAVAGSGTVAAAAPAVAGQSTTQAICNVYNGFRFQPAGSTAVYLVIDGERHQVPNEATYFRLWATWNGIQPNGGVCDLGDPLIDGAYLARELETGNVYLVGRRKRWIPNMTVFNQYSFDPARIRDEGRDYLPSRGPDIPERL
ncbi:hypothetical protein ACIOD2_41040 [Amycolatopsis sp. NPDC088138]|uniref:hypothetical protein n=1 Tax=Amycolatopsis sp. NPDC088138 TaxID=3363938 RepID=UPI0037F97AA5